MFNDNICNYLVHVMRVSAVPVSPFNLNIYCSFLASYMHELYCNARFRYVMISVSCSNIILLQHISFQINFHPSKTETPWKIWFSRFFSVLTCYVFSKYVYFQMYLCLQFWQVLAILFLTKFFFPQKSITLISKVFNFSST